MKNLNLLWIVAILIFGAVWFVSHNASAQPAQPPPAVAADTNSEAAIKARYRQGLISKEEAITEIMMLQNKKSMDIYGKVVDQYGRAVVGVSIRCDVRSTTGYMSSSNMVCFAETDAVGQFNFLGLHGAGMGIWPKKEGYFYNLKQPSRRPDNYQPDPNNPIVFTIWKIRGPEPLLGKKIEFGIPYNGTPTIFEISTGKQSANGDLRITLARFPLERPPGFVHPYDWHFKIEMLSGGLLPENDSYPYWGPEKGYQTSFDVNISSNNVPWKNQLEQDFYIKNSLGQYGRMHIDLTTTSRSPTTGITVQTIWNPSGSQNLEPDFSN